MSPWTLCGSATWAPSNQLLFTAVPAGRTMSAGNKPFCYVPGIGLVLSSGEKTNHRLGKNEKKRNMETTGRSRPTWRTVKATERRLAILCTLTSCPQARGSPPSPALSRPLSLGQSSSSRATPGTAPAPRQNGAKGRAVPHLPKPVSSPAQ